MEILAIVLQSLLALAFLGGGVTKLIGQKMHVDNFVRWRLPQWFRIVTGLVEIAGAAALIVGYWEPSWAAWGALWLGFTMLCGVLVHLRVRDKAKEMLPSVVLLVLAVVLALLLWSDLGDFPGF